MTSGPGIVPLTPVERSRRNGVKGVDVAFDPAGQYVWGHGRRKLKIGPTERRLTKGEGDVRFVESGPLSFGCLHETIYLNPKDDVYKDPKVG